MSQSFADSAQVIMSRVVLEIVTQKLLCTLYRRPMCRDDATARETCTTAAAMILTLFADLHREFQPGGQLESASWMLKSSIVSNFTLAIIVLRLRLSQDQDTGSQRERRVELLSQSLPICEYVRRKSCEAHRVAAAFKEMLKPPQPQMEPGSEEGSQANLAGMTDSENITRNGDIWPNLGEKKAYLCRNVDWKFMDQYMYNANGAMPLNGLEGLWLNSQV